MTPTEILERLKNEAVKFTNDTGSFERNKHMHDLKPSDYPDRKTVESVLNDFIKTFEGVDTHVYFAIPFLQYINESASKFINSKNLGEPDGITHDQQAAILTGFINSVGMGMCCDYAIYASDLK